MAGEVRGSGSGGEAAWQGPAQQGTAGHGSAAAGCRPGARVAAMPDFPRRVARPTPSAAARRIPAGTGLRLREREGAAGARPQGKGGGRGTPLAQCIGVGGGTGVIGSGVGVVGTGVTPFR